MIIGMFVTSQMLLFLLWRYFYSIFRMDSIHNANTFSRYFAHLGKMLNLSTANDSTFTVVRQGNSLFRVKSLLEQWIQQYTYTM